jgi:hypothetical protein
MHTHYCIMQLKSIPWNYLIKTCLKTNPHGFFEEKEMYNDVTLHLCIKLHFNKTMKSN